MSLDKWLKPEGEVKKKRRDKKEKENTLQTVSKPQKEKNGIITQKPVDSKTKKLSKFELLCSNRKCKYRKTIMKKLLSEKDKICPRCSSKMQVQKSN